GNAADTADPNGDGETNLLEFATAQDGQHPSKAAITCRRNGTAIEFTYARSKAALSDGVTFSVQWSTTLLATSWTTTGVTEQILSDDGTIQTVKATMDGTALPRCFLRLDVTRP